MTEELMIKAFFKAALITIFLGVIIIALFHYPIATIVVLFFGWLGLMIYLDPPQDWDK